MMGQGSRGRGLNDLIAPVKIYLWFMANEELRLTYKITVAAHSIPEARRLLDLMPMDETARKFYRESEPSNTWSTPWAQFEASREGKAISYCIEGGK